MDYRKIIAEAWAYTQQNKRLIIWFGFIPAIFTTTVGIAYTSYQFMALKVDVIDKSESGFMSEVLRVLLGFMQSHVSWTVPLIIILAVGALIYLLFPTLARAAAIQTIARNRNGQKAGVGTGFRYGILSYLQLFEYHLLVKTFAFFSILVEMSFVLRNLGSGIFTILLPVFILLMIVSLCLTLLFTFADFFIVIDDMGVFDSMKASGKLVITHWKQTVLISILMILIGVRIVIQAVLVFAIPALVILVTGYLASVSMDVIGLILGMSVGAIGLLLAAYLNGIVDVFSYTVWTWTFLDLTSQQELSARDVSARDAASTAGNTEDSS